MRWKDLKVDDVLIGEETFLLIKREPHEDMTSERFTYVVLEDGQLWPSVYDERSLNSVIYSDLEVLRATDAE